MNLKVKADTGNLTWDGKPMWAHAEPTPEEAKARSILGPWFRSEPTVDRQTGKLRRTRLADVIERLGE